MKTMASKEFFESGIVQFDKAKYSDAIDFFTKGIEADPENGLCYLYAGITHIFLRDTEKARPFIKKALECKLPPPYDDLAKGLQYFYYEIHNKNYINEASSCFFSGIMGRITNAESIYEKPKYTPDVFYFFRTLARYDWDIIRYEEKNGEEKIGFENLINNLNDALKINPNHAIYHYEKGRINVERYYKQKSEDRSTYYLKEALKDFDKAIEMDPTIANAEFYFHRGRAKAEATFSRGFFKPLEIDKKGAIADIEQAISMDNSNPIYCFDLAALYMELGKESSENYSQAVILFKKAADLVENEEDKQFCLRSMVTTAKLGNIHVDEEYADIEPYGTNQKNTGKEILSGLWGLAKKGMENVQNEYGKKSSKIEEYAEKYQDYDKEQLTEIIQTSGIFEEKAAAKRLLQEKE
jgi:tetratricopeptide (TPR) repeat protein